MALAEWKDGEAPLVFAEWKTIKGEGNGKTYFAKVIRIRADGDITVKWFQGGKYSILEAEKIKSFLKVGDIVSAVWKDTKGRGNGKIYPAKVIRLRADREEVYVKWLEDNTGSILNPSKIKGPLSL